MPPTTLDNPVHLNGHARCAVNPPAASTDPSPSPPSSSHPLAASPSQTPPSLPRSFNAEERESFLQNFLNPQIDSFDLANLFGLSRAQYHAYVRSEEFQQQLEEQTADALLRAQSRGKIAQPKAVATLETIIDSYNEAERNQLVRCEPNALGLRQRHRESARRAAWLLLKISGGIPPHLRAARPRSDSQDARSERLSPPASTSRLPLLNRAHDVSPEPHAPPEPHPPRQPPDERGRPTPPARPLTTCMADPSPQPATAPQENLSPRFLAVDAPRLNPSDTQDANGSAEPGAQPDPAQDRHSVFHAVNTGCAPDRGPTTNRAPPVMPTASTQRAPPPPAPEPARSRRSVL